MKIHDISLAQANTIWEEGYKFDTRIYEIMKLIIEIEQPSVVINRNPTLRHLVSLNSFNCGKLSLCLTY